MSWFKSLTGFSERSPEQVRENLIQTGNTIQSKVNGKQWVCGHLETPSLGELRKKTTTLASALKGKLRVSEVVAKVQDLHVDPANAGALFQVASQFNLLEMVAPSVTPERGIGIYENDPTQGPACAIAAGAGTIYRNYFAPVNGQIGQTEENQIDCISDLGKALGNEDEQLWIMENGYALPTIDGLGKIVEKIKKMSEPERDALRETLRIGVHWDTQVTLNNSRHVLTQAYCSALPVRYSGLSANLWGTFPQLVLEASYEATLHAALLNLVNGGQNKVYLTLLGGGAFGNREDWILAAIRRALTLFRNTPLEVIIVSFREANLKVISLIADF